MRHHVGLCVLLLTGCATVVSNDGSTVTVRHEFPLDADGERARVQDTAAASCRAVGKRAAELLTDVKINPSLPDAVAAHVASFRCT